MKIQNSKFKIQKYFVGLFFSFFIFTFAFCSLPAKADSVWRSESASPYTTDRAYKVGDIINIIILETTSAQNKAGTKTDVKDDLAAQFTHTIARLNPVIGPSNSATGSLSNSYSGSGQTLRSSNVQARISAWVTDVLPNGNLAIEGRHKIEVNDETQEIDVKGVIRPKDISGANTIYSYQIANVNLSIRGRGAVAEADSPGWLTRLLNWLF